ncbi:TRAP transporter substrate-binding protein [Psychromarinibacter sp. C21-152]|uniref:TRAP transporter substrate-binding protein n=1 Tax=Psychromarinibacter sediminicola TaxID=3033385 RepID=A0AAE3NU95_9RHOB|nr:TRAP transporter substrate-binding protein [Psychromarinibacter sediminicola]MDF0603643.1 TRAP transporter substrate-binding protein [Psychromarinibacter sediminicola]
MKLMHYAAAAALAVGAQAAPVLAETLKVSTFVPPKHAFNRMLESWGEELSEKTDGALTVEIFPAGQLGPPPRQFDLVRSGAADIAVVLHGATPGRFAMSELAGMPQTAPAAGNASAISSRRLTELAPDYLAEEHEGTKILWMAVTPPLKIHGAGDVPETLEDLEGLRIRYAGTIWQQIVETLGASPVPVPPAQTADALGKGVVDGATFPFEATLAFDLAPVTDWSITPGLSSATFSVVMSDAAYERLSDEHKALIDETTGPDRAEAFGEMWDAGEEHGLEYMKEGGVTIVELSEDQLATLEEMLAPIIENKVSEMEAAGQPAQAFLDAYTQ